MTTTVDFDALQAAQGPRVVLMPSTFVGPTVTGTDYADFSDFASVYVTAKASVHGGPRPNASLTVTVEHSDDGSSWSTAATLTLTNDGSQSSLVSAPKAHLRAVAVGTHSEWQVLVTAAPTYLDPPASDSGGSQPGAVRVLRHDFDFSQASALAAGVPIWTPAVDDVLLNAWIEYENWEADGEVIPLADLGIVGAGAWVMQTGVGVGLIAAFAGNPVDLSNSPWLIGANYSFFSGVTSPSMQNGLSTGVPFHSATPLALAVSSTGAPDGTAFDGSAGSASVYLAVSTPGDTP